MDSILGTMSWTILGVTIVIVSTYIALGSDFLKVGIAFLLQCLSLSLIFLALSQAYLGIFALFVAVFGTVLIISVGGLIKPVSGKAEHLMSDNTPSKALRWIGFSGGLVLGLLIAFCFLKLPLFNENANYATPSVSMGPSLLGDQVVAFELIALMALAFVIGAGILMRRTN